MHQIKLIASLFYKLSSFLKYLFCGRGRNKVVIPNMFFRSSFTMRGRNNILSFQGEADRTTLKITGDENQVQILNSLVKNCKISIVGDNNLIVFGDTVNFQSSTIIVRGENCKILIGNSSSFGGIRMVNVGKNNEIKIGSGCLFSDFIEMWASDTHPIFDKDMNIINAEKSITIGNKVWVGARTIILKGVTVDSGSIIGMGTTVVNDVPACSISVGNPNKLVRQDVNWCLNYPKD